LTLHSSVSGYYYKLNGYTHVSLPISHTVAITLIENAGIPFLEKEGITCMYLITQGKHVTELNRFAFREQCKQSYRFVILPTKEELEEMMTVCEENR